MATDHANDTEREDRARQHREFVEAEFAPHEFPPGKTPWEHGLFTVFVNGGAADYGRIHRASCPSISRVANATTYKQSGGTYAVFGRDGIGTKAQRCRTCGTAALPARALFWGDTEADVQARDTEQTRQERRRAYERALAEQERQASQDAAQEVLAAHADEVATLTAQHLQRRLAVVRERYADVAEPTHPA